MPIRLDSISDNYDRASVFTWIVQAGMDGCASFCVGGNGMLINLCRDIPDDNSGDAIGKLIYAIKVDKEHERLELMDFDLVLNGSHPTELHFLSLVGGTSDSNEQYMVETLEEGQHFEVETVNRCTVAEPLEDTVREAGISIFPFELTVFDTMEDLNRFVGFTSPINVGGTDMQVFGLSERFAMPGSVFEANNTDRDAYSLLVGEVKAFRDVRISMGENILPFVLASVDTAMGVVPVAMGREVFNLSDLRVGCKIAMKAIVKADIAPPDAYVNAFEMSLE